VIGGNAMLEFLIKTRKNKGFTLTELIIVVAIIGIIATLVMPAVMGYLDEAKLNTDLSNAAAMSRIVKNVSAPGGLDLSTVPDNTVISVIISYLGSIPNVKSDPSAHFLLNRNDASVTTSTAAEVPGTTINLNK
jgi:prepilin-type N-terminal cleavage/methylation domain-containing protein